MTDTPLPTTPLALVARMRALPGREEALETRLTALVAATREEDGCLTYDLHRGLHDPRLFVMYEIWASPAHHRAHRQTPHLREFAAAADELLEGGLQVEPLLRLDDPASSA